jgi:hypothetical protein
LSVQTSTTSGRLRRILRRTLYGTVGLIALLLLAESGLRLWLRQSGGAYDGDALIQQLELQLEQQSSPSLLESTLGAATDKTRMLHPFFGSEQGDDSAKLLEYFASKHPATDYKVVVVGGAPAAAWCKDQGAAFAQELEADPRLEGSKVRMLSYAHAGYKQPQQLNRVAFLLSLGYTPDAVINIDGFNEVTIGLANGLTGTHPTYPSPSIWATPLWSRAVIDPVVLGSVAELTELRDECEALLQEARKSQFHNSCLLGLIAKHRLKNRFERRAAIVAQMEQRASEKDSEPTPNREQVGSEFDSGEAAIIKTSITAWFEASRSLRALCKVRGVFYMHCLQPALYDAGAKPLSAQELQLPTSEHERRAVELGYPLLRERSLELEGWGIQFLDLTRCFEGLEQTLYLDACNVKPAGSALWTRRIAPFLLERALL